MIKKKIYYHDTDCGGVVYYANYLKYLEEGRTEYYHQRGVNLAETAKKGVMFTVVHVEADYTKPARYGDTIQIKTSIEKTGNCSIHFLQEVKKENDILLKAKVVLACVGKDFKPKRIPPDIRNCL